MKGELPVMLDGFVVRAYEEGLRLKMCGGRSAEFELDMAVVEDRYGERTADVVRKALDQVHAPEHRSTEPAVPA
jgi:hypothetical protein